MSLPCFGKVRIQRTGQSPVTVEIWMHKLEETMSGLRWTVVLALGILLIAPPTATQAQLPKLLPEAEEVTLALSAAPEHLRAGATVYALTEAGYKKVHEGSNGFVCAVYRDHPLAQKPTCWDAEGAETIVPRVLFEGELMMQGRARAAIIKAVEEGFRTARFISPRRAGIAYMLSPHILNYNSNTGQVVPFPPHVMIYAPNLTNADIGATPESFRTYKNHPFVAYQGPHGYLIVRVEKNE